MSQDKHTQGSDLPSERPDTSTGSLRGVRGSQAGDELINEITGIVNTSPSHSEAIKRVAAYAERRAIERAIRELSTLPRYEYPVGKISEHKYAVPEHMLEQRIAELTATLTGKDAS